MASSNPSAPSFILLATTYPIVPLDQCGPDNDRFEKVAEEYASRGYGGFDMAVQHILLLGKERVVRALAKHNLKIMAKIYSSGHSGSIPSENPVALAAAEVPHPKQGKTVGEHIAVWNAQIREAVVPSLRPFLLGIASQGGRDYFTHEDADAFFTNSAAMSKEIGLPIFHETHRHRLLYSPWEAVRMVRRHPELRLLGDLSHYCVVCEAAPDDADLNGAIVELIPRIGHVHARVGFEEGPQILDPREPRWAKHVEGHMAWWRDVFRAAKARGDAHVTVTPEFLPPPYAWSVHGSEGYPGTAVVDVHEVNHHMGAIVRKAFEEVMAEK
jgi:sugar phosphate isomerase/epimerase